MDKAAKRPVEGNECRSISISTYRRRRSRDTAHHEPAAAAAAATATATATMDGGNSKDINECAEDFIERFRQQLHLQRLESLENYRQKRQTEGSDSDSDRSLISLYLQPPSPYHM